MAETFTGTRTTKEVAMIARFPAEAQEVARHSSEETFYLRRLSRLARLIPSPGSGFAAEQLLRHAIFSTYVDCRQYGLEAEAQDILREATTRQAVRTA